MSRVLKSAVTERWYLHVRNNLSLPLRAQRWSQPCRTHRSSSTIMWLKPHSWKPNLGRGPIYPNAFFPFRAAIKQLPGSGLKIAACVLIKSNDVEPGLENLLPRFQESRSAAAKLLYLSPFHPKRIRPLLVYIYRLWMPDILTVTPICSAPVWQIFEHVMRVITSMSCLQNLLRDDHI